MICGWPCRGHAAILQCTALPTLLPMAVWSEAARLAPTRCYSATPLNGHHLQVHQQRHSSTSQIPPNGVHRRRSLIPS